MMGMKAKRRLHTIIFHVIVGGIAIFMFYPIAWMFFSSFKPTEQVMTTVAQLFPRQLDVRELRHWLEGLRRNHLRHILQELIFYHHPVHRRCGDFLHHGGLRIRPGRTLRESECCFLCMMITMMLPNQVIMIPQYIIFNMLGWVNTPSPIIVPAWCAKPLFIFMIMQFIEGNSAGSGRGGPRWTGAAPYTIFTRIIVPLVKPAMVTCAIFEFYWKWDDYMGSLLYLNSPEKYTVSIALKNFTDPMSSSDYGAMFAMCVLSLLPVIIIFMLLQKYIVEGVASTGIKG